MQYPSEDLDEILLRASDPEVAIAELVSLDQNLWAGFLVEDILVKRLATFKFWLTASENPALSLWSFEVQAYAQAIFHMTLAKIYLQLFEVDSLKMFRAMLDLPSPIEWERSMDLFLPWLKQRIDAGQWIDPSESLLFAEGETVATEGELPARLSHCSHQKFKDGPLWPLAENALLITQNVNTVGWALPTREEKREALFDSLVTWIVKLYLLEGDYPEVAQRAATILRLVERMSDLEVIREVSRGE